MRKPRNNSGLLIGNIDSLQISDRLGAHAAIAQALGIGFLALVGMGFAVLAPMIEDALADAFLILLGYLFLGHGGLLWLGGHKIACPGIHFPLFILTTQATCASRTHRARRGRHKSMAPMETYD